MSEQPQEQPEQSQELSPEQQEIKSLNEQIAKFKQADEAREQENLSDEQKQIIELKKQLKEMKKTPLINAGFTEAELAELDVKEFDAMLKVVEKLGAKGSKKTNAPSSNPNSGTDPNKGKTPYARDPVSGNLLYY